jgi:hypothetical protein
VACRSCPHVFAKVHDIANAEYGDVRKYRVKRNAVAGMSAIAAGFIVLKACTG